MSGKAYVSIFGRSDKSLENFFLEYRAQVNFLGNALSRFTGARDFFGKKLLINIGNCWQYRLI